MTHLEPVSERNRSVPARRLAHAALALATSVCLSGCGANDKHASQVLARVNGVDITARQVDDELRRADVRADHQEAAKKKLLESLIDRQLLAEEAMRNEIDGTPEVVRAIGRARVLILAHAYLKSVESRIDGPSTAEIDEYFRQHPEYFTQRKRYIMQKIVVATKDFGRELKAVVAAATSLDAVAAWLDRQHISYERGQFAPTTAELPEPLVRKLGSIRKDQLFVANEGETCVLISITGVKDSPVGVREAALQIEQYLTNKRRLEASDAEIAHLRSLAKIEYLAESPSAARAGRRGDEG